MILHIKDARYIGEYKVEVIFNNGRKGVADLSCALSGPVFEPLKDKALFSQMGVDEEMETIAWPNGADLAPEYIYFQAFKNEPELQSKFKEWGYIKSPSSDEH
jgi:hypothetical protein